MMTPEEITTRLRRLIRTAAEGSGLDDIVVDADTPIDGLGLDSLTILDLIYDIQQEFALDFSAEDLVEVRTMRDLVTFLHAKVAS